MGIRRNFRPTNEIVNGNFINGTANWTAIGATIAAADNVLSITAAGTGTSGQSTQITNVAHTNGKKIYARVKAKVTNSDCTGIYLRIQDASTANVKTITQQLTPTANQEYLLSATALLTADSNTVAVNIYHLYATKEIAATKVMEVSECMMIDYSALPSELQALPYLTVKAILDTWPWFDGTLSGGKHIA